jgi:hypothetical protein
MLLLTVGLLLAGALPSYAADSGELPQAIAKATPAVVAIIGKPSGTGNKRLGAKSLQSGAWHRSHYTV